MPSMPIGKQEAREFLVLLPLLVVVSAALMALLLLAGAQSTRHEYTTLGRQALDQVASIIGDADRITAELESEPVDPCSEAHLLAMRKALFRTHHLRDIGYFEGNLFLCSAGVGVLGEPMVAGDPDFQDRFGNSYWIDSPLAMFDGKRRGAVIRREHYNVVLDFTDLELLFGNSAWNLVYTHGGQVRSVTGEPGLYTGEAPRALWQRLTATGFQGCGEVYPYFCLAVEPRGSLWNRRPTLGIFLALGCSLVAGGLVTRLGWLYLKRRRSTLQRVTRGLKRNCFYWHFQPIVDLATGSIVGCEALARFRDEQGSLGPADFIPTLRDAGLSWQFTQRMVSEVLTALHSEDAIPPGFRIGLNLFPRDTLNPSVTSLAEHPACRNSRLTIVLEVTEDEALDAEESRRHLQELHEQGFIVAIDDFGVGYSNLGQLQRIHCDIVKIDRSFIQDMEENSVRSSIIPQIVDIARILKLDVVGEGIENERQRQALIAAGVIFGQGWLFGRPGTLAELVALLHEHT